MERNIVWSRLDIPGMEHLQLIQVPHGFTANGFILAVHEETPYRIRYIVHCDSSWRVREVRIDIVDKAMPEVHLKADGKGHWTTGTGAHVVELNGCIDVDVSATPFTNTIAIERLGLAIGEIAELDVAYINVPTMQTTPVKQRYTRLEDGDDGQHYQYIGLSTGFQAELVVDRDKLVVAYPKLFMRVWSSEELASQE